ncbi:MAG: protein kinase [Deltaproteobacteria bacterium]|nr:protein kinase [Deltaproteobacteria bacterium]
MDGERLIQSQVDPLIGRTLDRYKIVGPIGTGGMAKVYRATHLYLEQDFAVKVLHGQLAADKALTKRFHREAKTLSRIKHPNVVAVADFGATKEGLLFMVMELLEGVTVSEALRRDGPMPPARAGRIIKEVASGLAAAHGRGFVHRDLKPGNLMLVINEQGVEQAKILDFGLVRLLEPDASDGELTHRGQFFGTPSYMSPEQATGGEVGPASDLYSLGVILYQLLTGTPPFTGDVQQLAQQHVTAPPPVPPLPYGGLTDLAVHLLQKEPNERPRSAEAVVQRIEQLGLSQLPTKASERPRRSQKPARVSEPPTRADRGDPLSAPILAEERAHLPIPEDSREMTRSINAALGFQRFLPWIAAVLTLGAAAGGYYYLNNQPEDPIWERQPEAEAVEATPPAPSEPPRAIDAPAPEPERSATERPKPKPAGPGKSAGEPPSVVIKPTTPEHTPPPAPAPPAVSNPPSDAEGPTEEGTDYQTAELTPPIDDEPGLGKTYKELDLALGWARSHRGLSWADIAAAEPTHAQNWARWFKSEGEPPRQIVELTYQALMNTTEEMPLDRNLFDLKLKRIRTSLNQVPEAWRDARYQVLEGRYRELKTQVGYEPFRREALAIATDLTMLEGDAASAAIEATAKPVKTSSTS